LMSDASGTLWDELGISGPEDEATWETLYQRVSRPFGLPTTGRIAVREINDYGDEAMKVIKVK